MASLCQKWKVTIIYNLSVTEYCNKIGKSYRKRGDILEFVGTSD